MSKHVKHVAKHRGAPSRPDLADKPRKALGTTLVLTSLAVAATGVTVAGGLLVSSPAGIAAADIARDPAGTTTDDSAQDEAGALPPAVTGPADGAAFAAADVTRRAPETSRSSDRRKATDPLKKAALAEPSGPSKTGSENLSQSDPRDVARALLAEFGFSSDQFGCLDSLYMRESGWNVYADNPSSSAYGIPQALPGSKMSSAGADWATNPVTQIRWGLGYIQDRYGSPCGAWGHSQSVGWY